MGQAAVAVKERSAMVRFAAICGALLVVYLLILLLQAGGVNPPTLAG